MGQQPARGLGHTHAINGPLPDSDANTHNSLQRPRSDTPRAHRLTSPLTSALCTAVGWPFNIALLGFPIYLQSQGRAIREEAKRCKGSYDEWINAMASIPLRELPQTERIAASGHQWVTYSPHPIPDTVSALEHSWSTYVMRRDGEWCCFLLPISLAFIG